jgi:hypothetical protein
MTNEQTAALLYGISQAINHAKYDVTNAVNSDGPLTEETSAAIRIMERLEDQITRQIQALFGVPPC